MPKWGLTAAMRQTAPWGLAEHWLEPGKVLTDPVHGDIHLMELEMTLVNSPAFQRLRKVRQLGTTHLVYPGATHTRFAHSLGAVKVAQDLLDTVVEQRSSRDPEPDLFREWEAAEAGYERVNGRYVLDADGAERLDRRLAEVTILTRLGALLHDLTHVPFGHSIEDDLKILKPHDENRDRFDRLWRTVPTDVRDAISAAPDLERNLRRLILSKAERLPEPQFEFVEDIVGNTICADLLDYLRRDHLYTGLPLALGRRFEAGYYVMPNGDPDYQRRMVLRVHRKGEERIDAITEILKHLRYRYELSERALVHHTKVAADAMIGKALEMWRDALWAEEAADTIAGKSGDNWAAGTEIAELTAELKKRHVRVRALTKRVRHEIDVLLTSRGDDGVIEYLRALPEAPHPKANTRHRDVRRRAAVAELAMAIEERRLYKRIAVQHHTRKSRDDFFDDHGGADERRRIERRAARFAGVEPAWRVLVWIPSPKMRLKVANVLVDDGKEIQEFHEREKEGKGRGTDIYDSHRNLWGVSVYVHPELQENDETCRLLLASLAADLNLQLGGLEYALGPSPHEWPERIALEYLGVELREELARIRKELRRRSPAPSHVRAAELRRAEQELASQVDAIFRDVDSDDLREEAVEELLARQLQEVRRRGDYERPPLRKLVGDYRSLLD